MTSRICEHCQKPVLGNLPHFAKVTDLNPCPGSWTQGKKR